MDKKHLAIAIIVIIIAIAMLYLVEQSAYVPYSSGNFGNWYVESYNPFDNELIIPISLRNVDGTGYLGSGDMVRQGTLALNSQYNCEKIGWKWQDERCWMNQDSGWVNNFMYMGINVECYKTCHDPRGCFGVGKAEGYSPDFNGDQIIFDDLTIQSAGLKYSCEGQIVLSNKECENSEKKCEGEYLYQCENNNFVNKGLVHGECGYSIPLQEKTWTGTIIAWIILITLIIMLTGVILKRNSLRRLMKR